MLLRSMRFAPSRARRVWNPNVTMSPPANLSREGRYVQVDPAFSRCFPCNGLLVPLSLRQPKHALQRRHRDCRGTCGGKHYVKQAASQVSTGIRIGSIVQPRAFTVPCSACCQPKQRLLKVVFPTQCGCCTAQVNLSCIALCDRGNPRQQQCDEVAEKRMPTRKRRMPRRPERGQQ